MPENDIICSAQSWHNNLLRVGFLLNKRSRIFNELAQPWESKPSYILAFSMYETLSNTWKKERLSVQFLKLAKPFFSEQKIIAIMQNFHELAKNLKNKKDLTSTDMWCSPESSSGHVDTLALNNGHFFWAKDHWNNAKFPWTSEEPQEYKRSYKHRYVTQSKVKQWTCWYFTSEL